MKKQTNLSAAGRKLSLNKKTISNLQSSEMVKIGGGYWTVPCHTWGCPPQPKMEKKRVTVIIPASTLVLKIKSKAAYNSKSFIKQ